MSSFTKLKKTNFIFLLFGLWLCVLSILLQFTSRYQLFVLINYHRNIFADIVFTIFTELGSGYILIPILLIFIFQKKYKNVFNLLCILLINTLLVSWLKHSFYQPRPLLVYGKNVVMTAHWVTLCQNYSFPSGHTSLGFAIASYFSFLYKKKNIIFFSFMGAICIGYSRVYLGQHFVFDVFGGSILGFCITCIYYFITEVFQKYRNKKTVVDCPIILENIPS